VPAGQRLVDSDSFQRLEGFSENDWDPLTATTSMVSAVPDTGDGVLRP